MVANVLEPTPAKNLATSIPAKDSVRAQPRRAIVMRQPEKTKTGRRPLISDRGARNIGAAPKPTAQVVMPVLKVTLPISHFLRSSSEGMEYAPAVYAESIVTADERTSINIFLLGDHENGEMNGTRFGKGGEGRLSLSVMVALCFKGRGFVSNGVSKSR